MYISTTINMSLQLSVTSKYNTWSMMFFEICHGFMLLDTLKLGVNMYYIKF